MASLTHRQLTEVIAWLLIAYAIGVGMGWLLWGRD